LSKNFQNTDPSADISGMREAIAGSPGRREAADAESPRRQEVVDEVPEQLEAATRSPTRGPVLDPAEIHRAIEETMRNLGVSYLSHSISFYLFLILFNKSPDFFLVS
jgi:hypothetical protein